jgi:hypothetical protein
MKRDVFQPRIALFRGVKIQTEILYNIPSELFKTYITYLK